VNKQETEIYKRTDKNGIKKRMKRLMRYKLLYLMLVPGLLVLALIYYLPMFGVIIAFKNVNYQLGILKSPWVGLDNFKYLFNSNNAWIMTRNTLLYNGFFIISGLVVSVGMALMLNELRKKFAAKLYQTIILAPYFLSMVVVSYLVFALLGEEQGFLNTNLLPKLGMDPVGWYRDAKLWVFILPLVQIWKYSGYGTVVYLAAIVGVDKELHEAAKIDGANRWKQIWHVTIPTIRPVIVVMTLMSIAKIFYSDFGLFYNVPMNTGMLIPTTQVIDTFVYRSLIGMGNIGMSSAAALYQSLVGFVLVLVSNFVIKKVDSESAMF
jgi:putative aldouronate transport system permease protein